MWLVLLALMMLAMIALGGLTRLSGSGLSMVHWKPIRGAIPPLNQEQWEEEFGHYKQYPEYKKVNTGMSLPEFKKIFWIEFLHRSFGRLIGVVFFIPFLYFLFTKRMKTRWLWATGLVGILGGLQGLVGWYMVKSGLVERPQVSHYRLTLHLALALTLYATVLFLIMRFYFPFSGLLKRIWKAKIFFSLCLIDLLFIQILSGGLVAGMHAGTVFRDIMKPGVMAKGFWLEELGMWNLLENVIAVMTTHMVLAFTIAFLMLIVLWITRSAKLTAGVTLLLLLVQVSLGLMTGMSFQHGAPIALGSLHQMGAMFLFTAYFTHVYFVMRRDSASV